MTTVDEPPSPPPPAPPAPSRLLRAKLDALGRRHVAVHALTGLAMALVVGLELLALAMFLDWWLELPWGLRLVSLIAQLGVLGYILVRFILLPIVSRPDEDQLALMVEKARPEFRTRLIAAIQLVRPGAVPPGVSRSLVGALVEETEALARPSDFRDIVCSERLTRLGAMAVVVLLVGLMGFLAGRQTCADLLRRVCLARIPVPRKTHIIVPEGDRLVGVGDTIRLEAFVQGIIPAHGKVEIKYRSRRAQEFPLEQNRDNRLNFARKLENVQESFTYQFSLGDGLSEIHRVRAIPRPTISAVACEQEYPGYTGLKPVPRSLGDLSLLAGSVLKLRATATKDITNASLKLVGLNRELPMSLNPEKPRELGGQFLVPAQGLAGFQLQMIDQEGMESRDNAIYRVDILPDKVPVVRITYPDRKEELVTPQATMRIGFEASDDFEIARIRLLYKIDTVENGAESMVELDLEEQHPQRVRRRYEWSLGSFAPRLSEGSTIEYWVEVTDNNDATGPGVGRTDHQLAKVVSEAEKRADLLNRAGDYLGSISDVAGDQEKLNKDLGLIIKAKVGLK